MFKAPGVKNLGSAIALATLGFLIAAAYAFTPPYLAAIAIAAGTAIDPVATAIGKPANAAAIVAATN